MLEQYIWSGWFGCLWMDLTRQFSVFECTEFLKSYFWDSDFTIQDG